LGGNGSYSSKCNFLSPLFGIEKTGALKSVNKRFSPLKRRSESELYLRVADFRLFWAKNDYPLPLASLFSNFSTAKKLHSKERKQKPFAAQTPQRKRGFLSTHQTIVGKISPHLRNFKSSLADAPHCSMGLVSK